MEVHFRSYYEDKELGLAKLTDVSKGCLIANISSDGQYALVYLDKMGKERGHWYKIDPKTKEKTCLTKRIEPFTAFNICTAEKNANVLVGWIGLGDKNAILRIDNALNHNPKPEILHKTSYSLGFPALSFDGKMISFIEESRHSITLFIYKDNEIFYKKSFQKGRQIEPIFFQSTNKLILTIDKKIQILDLKEELLGNLPLPAKGDFWLVDFNSDINQLLLAQADRARVKLYLYDFENNELKKVGNSQGVYDYFVTGGYLLKDRIMIRWQSEVDTPCIRTLTIKKGFTTAPSSKEGILSNKAEVSYIEIPTEECKTIQGWLHLPKGIKNPIPMIIDLHGGPNSCVFDEFSPEAQIFTQNGFGVFYVNYHGSTTFGKDFEMSIYGKPGILEAEDAVIAKNYLVQKGFANKKKCYLQGWSWGGFVALLTAGLYPLEFAKIVSLMGVGDNISAFQGQHGYLKKFDKKLYGGTPAKCPEIYQKSNPAYYAEKVRSPILIIHGKNDNHCPAEQMENYIKKLKLFNKEVTVFWNNYGHLEMFSSSKVRLENIKKILDFYK